MAVIDIVLDIETIPGPVPPSPECIQAPANYKDPEKTKEVIDEDTKKNALGLFQLIKDQFTQTFEKLWQK